MLDNINAGPQIIFEDSDLMVVDKPAGWIVNKSNTTGKNKVLQDWLSIMDYPLSRDEGRRSGIVHRLDKETSGVIIIAKNQSSFDNIQAQFKARVVEKKYITLVHGRVDIKSGEISVPLGRLPWNRERFGVVPGGRVAQTFYKVLDYYSRAKDTYTLIEVYPKTGRTHQIRVHMKYVGHPVVSDTFYAGRKVAKKDLVWCKRLFLHSNSILFRHPMTGNVVTVQSNLSKDLKQALVILNKI